ncbi:MAG: hypothetical protein P8N56_00395 [Schleiferiaceae bacterium]|nr:hypothetical protein [Schleiferiaceae bacterium]
MRSIRYPYFTLAILGLGLLTVASPSCDRGEANDNRAPETHLAVKSIERSGPDRLNSKVEMSWYGTDIDGYVTGYELSLDGQNWKYSQSQDSTFLFAIPAGSDTADITLYVRAIDNLGAKDESPATLIFPLKNAPPVAEIDQSSQSLGNALGVLTYRWSATDPDGNETIAGAEIRFNNGDWHTIDPKQSMLTFVLEPDQGGGMGATASMFYGNALQATLTGLDGLQENASNILQVRIQDIAGAQSAIDSALAVQVSRPSSDLLFVSGQTAFVTAQYQGWMDTLNLSYDLLDLNVNSGESRPYFWNPTFRHILSQYDRVLTVTNSDNALDPVTGATQPLLAHMAQALQNFTGQGGKLMTSTAFGPNTDFSPFVGSFPMDGIVSSSGQVRLLPDSALVPQVTGPFPNLHPASILIGISPLVPSADAEIFYRAQLTKLSGWQGDNVVGVRRKYLGNPAHINEVFFSMELHRVASSSSDMNALLEQILVYDFNW